MRIFDHPNMGGGFICPACGTSEDKPVVLIAIDGTEEGRIAQAAQVHADCLDDLRIYKDTGIIAMRIKS